MDNLKQRINDFLANSDITNLNRLGFTKNYLSQLKTEEDEEEPKSELEQVKADIAAAQEAQQVTQGRQYLSYNANKGTTNFNLNVPAYDFNKALQNYLSSVFNDEQSRQAAAFNPSFNLNEAKAEQARKYIAQQQQDLNNYFASFATSWKPNYESGQSNKDTMQNYLSRLFSTYNKGTNTDGTPITDYAYDWKKYFTQIGDNQFLINGSLNKDTGRYAYYVPGQGIIESNILDTSNPYIAQQLGYTIPSQKQGGKVEFLQSGGGFDYNAWAASQEEPKSQVTNKPHQTSTSKQKSSPFSSAENARIAATIADIASMGAAFVPGYGTATSAILGLGSTATNFGADLADGQGLWDATKNVGFGLAADVMGLIPGLGGIGKGAKIARNLMWAVPKMMQWANTYQGLQNAGEIKNSIMKLTSPSSMTVQDWQNVSQALQIMTGHGRSVATKIKKAGMSKTTTTTDPEYYIFTNKDKQKVSDETFKKLREARGTKARQALTQELMGEGVILQQTRFAPWNTSTRFGAFKEIPGKTKVEVKNKHKGWFSDENLVEKAENFDPSVDIRSILHKVNPYRAYYSNRVPKSSPLPEYLQRPVDILPQGFGMTKSGMAAGGFNMDKPKRKPLTEEQKAARRQKSTAKKQEQKAKELENLRRQQMYGMSEEIPQASSQTINIQRKQEHTNLSSRFANEVEMPGPQMETQKNKFYRRYGNAVRGHQLGEILKALRNGGIIKAYWGDSTKDWFIPEVLKQPEQEATYTNPYFPNIQYTGTAPWFKSRFSGEKVINLGEDASNRGDLLGANTGSNLDYAFARNMAYVRSGQKNKEADIQGYFNSLPSPVDANNLEGLTAIYNGAIDELYSPFTSGNDTPDYLKTDATKHNLLFRQVYGSRAKTNKGDDNYDIGWNPEIIGTFGSASFARRPINYETKFEDDLKNNIAQAKDRVSKISHNGIEGYVYTDENGRIHPLSQDQLDIINGKTVKKDDPKKDDVSIADEETERDNIFKTQYRNPIDPTLPIIGAKTAMGLIGNDNIYRNLLDEMPQAPLRDPIQRQLAIVGWQDRIKNGQNQIADIRNINRRQFGYDPQTNFATSLETERTGRDISDKAFAEDAGRQFETAQKLWNLKNEDTMYNIGVGDANRRSIADRARMMAQIRAAWRSGNNNILMGALSDTGNWLMKKYQREQDLTDKVKELSLGNLESYADWALRNDPTYKQLLAKKQAGTLTEADRAKMLEIKMSMQDKLANEYADKYYNLYHTSLFGGGSNQSISAKDGTKLEVEKLKARGKDNDRYVSMIKDLRTTTYRRRRRR